MIAIILGIFAAGIGMKLHSYFIAQRPGPEPALSLLSEPYLAEDMNEGIVWKKHSQGDVLLTPMKDDYVAVLVHAVMEGNFYNVRLLSDPSKHIHVHATQLFTREEIEVSKRTEN